MGIHDDIVYIDKLYIRSNDALGDTNDIVLGWQASSTPEVNYYAIYKSESGPNIDMGDHPGSTHGLDLCDIVDAEAGENNWVDIGSWTDSKTYYYLVKAISNHYGWWQVEIEYSH